MNKIARAFMVGFMKAADAPQFFDTAQKPGLRYPWWSLLLPRSYVMPSTAGQPSSVLDRMTWHNQDLDKRDLVRNNFANLFNGHADSAGQLEGLQSAGIR
jgi:hypothetical protein